MCLRTILIAAIIVELTDEGGEVLINKKWQEEHGKFKICTRREVDIMATTNFWTRVKAQTSMASDAQEANVPQNFSIIKFAPISAYNTYGLFFKAKLL